MKDRFLRILLAAWGGSLWTICGVVAPSLFAVVPERQLAGQVAGYFFGVATWLGVAFGSIVLAIALLDKRRDRFAAPLIVVTGLAPVLSELAFRPMMESARAAGDMAKFGMLHGVSALLFGIACVGAVLLVWRGISKREDV